MSYRIQVVENLGPMGGDGKRTYVAVITDTATGKTAAQSSPQTTPNAAKADATTKFKESH